MRTTLTLDDDVARRLETEASRSGRPFEQLANEYLRVALVQRKALQLGAKDEGAAGPRGEGFYAGYFRDLDGNKLNFFHMG